MISCKTKGEVALMRQAGRVVGLTLEKLSKELKTGEVPWN